MAEESDQRDAKPPGDTEGEPVEVNEPVDELYQEQQDTELELADPALIQDIPEAEIATDQTPGATEPPQAQLVGASDAVDAQTHEVEVTDPVDEQDDTAGPGDDVEPPQVDDDRQQIVATGPDEGPGIDVVASGDSDAPVQDVVPPSQTQDRDMPPLADYGRSGNRADAGPMRSGGGVEAALYEILKAIDGIPEAVVELLEKRARF